MAAADRNDRFPSARSNPTPPINQLAERVRHYFDRHAEACDEPEIGARQHDEYDGDRDHERRAAERRRTRLEEEDELAPAPRDGDEHDERIGAALHDVEPGRRRGAEGDAEHERARQPNRAVL